MYKGYERISGWEGLGGFCVSITFKKIESPYYFKNKTRKVRKYIVFFIEDTKKHLMPLRIYIIYYLFIFAIYNIPIRHVSRSSFFLGGGYNFLEIF